jgi:hypothetical protein
VPGRGRAAWLKAADLEHEGDNPVFRPVSRSGVESRASRTRPSIASSKRAARGAPKGILLRAQSARGPCDRSARAGADRAAIKRQTGHRSDAMLDRYARETNLAANNSSSSLGL